MAEFTADELDAAYAAVIRRYPNLTGSALMAKVRRVAAIIRHNQNAQVWTRKD